MPPSRRREVQKNLERAAKSGKIKDRKDLSKYIGQKIFNGDNQHVREWYVANVSNIPNLLDKALTLEGQTRQAYALRNGFKHKARIAMADKKTAEYLDKKYPAPLFDELLERKMKRKHLTREQALLDILHTASVTNEEVNREFGL